MKPGAALDLQIDLHRYLRTPDAKAYMKFFSESLTRKNLPERAQVFRGDMIADTARGHLSRAGTYVMARDIVQLLWSAASIKPLSAINQSELPTPDGFLVLDRAVYFKDIHGRRMGVSAILWMAVPGGIQVMYFTDRHDTGDEYLQEYLKSSIGQLIPPLSLCHMEAFVWGSIPKTARHQDIDWEEVRTLAILAGDKQAEEYGDLDPGAFNAAQQDAILVWQFLTTFFAFVKQRIIRPHTHAPDKWLRKRLRREDMLVSGDINVVVLRADASRPSEPGDGEPVAWSHRWIVRGHWHDYWYSSVESALASDATVIDTISVPGKVKACKYLEPYWKGPEDAEPIVKDTVFVVRR